jgi:hypothetical protein
MNESLTEYLLKQTSKLPVQQLREVIDFTEFLASKVAAGAVPNGQSRRALKHFVGGVQDGSIASGIDEELYGSSVR